MPKLLLLLLLPLVASFAQSSKATTGIEDETLKQARALLLRVAEELEGVEQLHGEFVQEQHTLLLDEAIRSEGRLHLRAKPGCLLMELQKPRQVEIRSDAKTHQVYHPAQKKAERYLFESNELAKSLLSILTADLGKIEEGLEVRAFTGGEEQSTIELRPKDPKRRKVVETLSLTVDTKGASLKSVSFSNSDGERTVLSLSKLRKVDGASSAEDRKLESAVFDRPLPEDVKVIVHRVPTKSEPR